MWLIGEARRGRSRAGHSGRRQREQGSASIREPSGSVLLSGQSPSGICFPLRIGDRSAYGVGIGPLAKALHGTRDGGGSSIPCGKLAQAIAYPSRTQASLIFR